MTEPTNKAELLAAQERAAARKVAEEAPTIRATYEERRAMVAARRAAEEALPDEVQRLLDGMRWRLCSTGKMKDYIELKRLCVEIWGPK